MHKKLIDKNCGCEMGFNSGVPLPGAIEIFTFGKGIFLLKTLISRV